MTWKIVGNTDPGQPNEFGGDDIDKISKLFNGNLDVDTVDFNSPIKFRDGKIELRNVANTFSYKIVGSAILADRNLTLPLLTADDTLAVLGLAQTFTGLKTFDSGLVVTTTQKLNLDASGGDTYLTESSSNVFDIYAGGVNTFKSSATQITLGAPLDLAGLTVTNLGNIISGNANPATVGKIRLANGEGIYWRNFANGANLALKLDTGDLLVSDARIDVTADGIRIGGATTGSLMKHDGSRFYYFNRGTSLQHLRVNSGGTDLEWATITSTDLPSTIVYNNQANTYSGGGTQDFAGATLDNVAVLISNATNPATVGVLRLGNNEAIEWRNAANSADLPLVVNASNILQFNSDTIMLLSAQQTVLGLKRFTDGTLLLKNSADNNGSTIATDDQASSKTIRVPTISTSTEYFVLVDASQTLTGKTFHLDNNSLTASAMGTGDLIKNNGSKFVKFSKGTSLQQLRVNSGGTDLEWFTPSGGAGDMVLADVQTVTGAKTFLDQTLKLRNPADTFSYTLVHGAISANRSLNVPVITATDTLAVLLLAQTFSSGAKTFNDNILKIRNPADTFSYSLRSSAIVADRDVTIPLLTASDTFAMVGFANAWGTVNQNISSTGKWQEGGVSISPIGVHDIGVSAAGMWVPASNAATPADTDFGTNVIRFKTMNFTSTTADEKAQFNIPLPRNYNNGNIDVEIRYSFASGSGNIVFGVRGRAISDNEAIDGSWGTLATVTDGAGTADQINKVTITGITIGNTPIDADEFIFELQRVGSNASDTFTGTVRVHSVVVRITTDAAVAA